MTSHLPFELEPSWFAKLKNEIEKPYMAKLASFLEEEKITQKEIFPPQDLVFNAFRMCPYEETRVVILGQDPYHGIGQAHGLSFSVPIGVPQPPSLQNIFKEIQADLNISRPNHGCLVSWAKQGVLLLNSILTVRKGQPLSHHKKGWEQFTDEVIRVLAMKQTPMVFVLWGKYAQDKAKSALEHVHLEQKHLILTAAHPSPYSANNGFFGCRHFSKINQFLEKNKQTPIEWKLQDINFE
ncbi:Uracil-DNA glycosylase [Candidatus Rubidus massiliensis]|nr:MAG: uracil-DNA glycosylase [Chlamydia sp. 32-24]CDZ79891.1 Uracil-DNA glycosylase [Candidatus Rubidus massiliensis]